jgi:lactate dehydrogenase-like 2-hydroxyacid dehydrogenase
MHQTVPKKILIVTRRWPKEVELRIARDYEARINLADRLYSSDELIDISQGADAPLIAGQDRMDADVISHLPSSVRVIATLSVGFDPH